VDVYFVHNPETQLEAGVARERFDEGLRAAFAMLEDERRGGRIGVYGLATWNGLRRPPGHPGHISLERTLGIAQEVGGDDHGFRAIELPFNLAMPDAARSPTQRWRGRDVPVLEAAREAGLLVLGSATLMQGQLLRRMSPAVRDAIGAPSELLAAVQFSRSTPGITSALIGTGRLVHAQENVKAAAMPTRPEAALALLGAI
jgi:aryl-alcohol dehydrogenase-like predicted oxidoreductase